MSFLTTQPGAWAVSVGTISGPAFAAYGGIAATSTCVDLRIPTAGEGSAYTAAGFTASAELFDSLRAQAPAVLRQLADVMTLSAAAPPADPTTAPLTTGNPGR